ncbi:NADH:ubiquinone reductase (H(+)-translocating) [Bertholletia excelsa]
MSIHPHFHSLKRRANCLLARSCMSGNVHVRLCEKGGGQKWPCCTSLPSSMGSALSFLGEYANMILMRCRALHLTFVGLPSSGACVLAFLCNKPFRLKTSGRWSCRAFGEG